MLALVGALLLGALVLFAFGNALGAKGRHQRAADLAAVSAAQVMRYLYPRLFEPPFIEYWSRTRRTTSTFSCDIARPVSRYRVSSKAAVGDPSLDPLLLARESGGLHAAT